MGVRVELLPFAFMLMFSALPFLFGDDDDDEEPEEREDTVLRGTDGDDTLTGGDGIDVIEGLGGNDAIFAGEASLLDGGDGDDTITANVDFNAASFGNPVTVLGGTGDDTISVGQNASVSGGDGDDTILADLGGTLSGGDGDDIIRGSDNSTIFGGDGNDIIDGLNRQSIIDAGAGDDLIAAQPGTVITSGTGGDTITLTVVTDQAGEIFNDGQVIINDYVAGQDSYELAGTELIDPETGEVTGQADITFVETAEGVGVQVDGFAFILLRGVTLEDINSDDFVAVADDDPALPPVNSGITTITGDDTDETFAIGPDTILNAGDGDDTVTSDLDRGTSTVFGGDGNDTLSGNADLFGGAGDDRIAAGFQSFGDGGDGNDILVSGLESTMFGGAGDDEFQSASGDVITMGEGEDALYLQVAPNNASDIFNSGLVTVTDYTAGEDVYVLTGAALFDDLPPTEVVGVGAVSFTQSGDDVQVRIADIPFIVLQNTTVEDIDPEDFVVVDPIVTVLPEPSELTGSILEVTYPRFEPA